jgi:tetratricopeptide (TPR) repeat protein
MRKMRGSISMTKTRPLALAGYGVGAITALALTALAPAGSAFAQNRNPQQATIAHTEALKIYRAGERSRALARVDAGLAIDPQDAQLRFLRGVLLTELKRNADAIATFRTLIEDFPELPEPYNNLAVLQASNGDIDSARITLEQAIRALPSYGLAQENLGDLYLRLAVRAWEQAEYLSPAQAPRLQERLVMARELIARDLSTRNLAARSAPGRPAAVPSVAPSAPINTAASTDDGPPKRRYLRTSDPSFLPTPKGTTP